MSVNDVLARSGPRKLLALDGGGIRGVITIEMLGSLEAQLQKALHRDDSFVLADYFDYIAGTSTGAIIAACLAMGKRVDEVRRLYVERGQEMFDRAGLLNLFRYRFNHRKLAARLQAELGADTTLGSDTVRTLLMIVLRNATTDSPWPLSNNPYALYNQPGVSGRNTDLRLWQLVRASAAAPVFFAPEEIHVGDNRFLFVDGGLTMYNNPAFQLFLMATVERYWAEAPEHRWPAGEDKMLLVSLGTGSGASANAGLKARDLHLLYNAKSVPAALMFAALNEQDFLCRVFGKCLAGEPLDSEVGDMIARGQPPRGGAGPTAPKLFTYLRYNANLTRAGLDQLGIAASVRPQDVQKLDSVRHIGTLQQIGRSAAAKQMSPEQFATHFAGFL